MNQYQQTSATIDVVDPDRTNYDVLARLAWNNGAALRYFASGREALRQATDGRAAVWLISIELPDMTGFDLCEMLRDRLDGAALCMIAARYRVEDEIRAYRAGATIYTCKPVEATWLQECVLRLYAEFTTRRCSGTTRRCNGNVPLSRQTKEIW